MTRSLRSTLVGTAVAAMVVAGCAGTGSSATPGSSLASVAPATDPAPPATSAAPTATEAVPSSTASDTGVFFLCPSATADPTCPLTAGPFRADTHDAFELVIPDDSWQEERSPASDEPTVILSRTDAPDQRVSIDTGSTSAILDDAALLALVAEAAPYQAGEPVPASIGGASGYQVDLVPADGAEFVVPGAGPVVVEPGHSYRLFALQLPMGQESGIKVILIDAPTDQFEAFSSTSAELLDSLTFH